MSKRYFTKAQKLAVALVQGINDMEGLEADHIRPYSKGGETSVENCQLIPRSTNRKKGSKFMELRKWQKLFIKEWESREINSPFLLVATPGGGKTFAALTVAKKWMDAGADRRLIVVVPSSNLRIQWRDEATGFGVNLQTNELGTNFKHGFQGGCATYQAVSKNPYLFASLCSKNPTMVILDEIHHCGDQASFGYGIKDGFALAKEKLLLSGTPWKTTGEPIPFISYDGDGFPVAHFRYDYPDAIKDDVLRIAAFVHKGGWIEYSDRPKIEFNREMTDEDASRNLRNLLNSDGDFIRHLIREAHEKLIECRRQFPDAAAMACCIEKSDADRVAKIIKEETGTTPSVIVSDDEISNDSICRFRKSRTEWLVTVRMVSEGTDIKRLQVLCYLTNWVTELFFRQLIARVLRKRSDEYEEAYVYLPNDPRLVNFSNNIERAQQIAIQEQAEKETSEIERQEREPKLFEDFTTGISGEDVFYIGNREYSKDAYESINQMALETRTTLEVAARFWEFHNRPAQSTENQNTQPASVPLEEELLRLRRKVNRSAGFLTHLTGKKHSEIHRQFIPQSDMTVKQLNEKLRVINQWILEAKNESNRKSANM